jgi:hypothetical protein
VANQPSEKLPKGMTDTKHKFSPLFFFFFVLFLYLHFIVLPGLENICIHKAHCWSVTCGLGLC